METVRRIRKARGLSQSELAKRAGTTQYTVSEIELGHRDPHPATLKRLAAVLDVPVAEFFAEASSVPKALPPLQSEAPEPVELTQRRGLFAAKIAMYAEAIIGAREIAARGTATRAEGLFVLHGINDLLLKLGATGGALGTLENTLSALQSGKLRAEDLTVEDIEFHRLVGMLVEARRLAKEVAGRPGDDSTSLPVDLGWYRSLSA